MIKITCDYSISGRYSEKRGFYRETNAGHQRYRKFIFWSVSYVCIASVCNDNSFGVRNRKIADTSHVMFVLSINWEHANVNGRWAASFRILFNKVTWRGEWTLIKVGRSSPDREDHFCWYTHFSGKFQFLMYNSSRRGKDETENVKWDGDYFSIFYLYQIILN